MFTRIFLFDFFNFKAIVTYLDSWGSASEGKLGFDSKEDVNVPTRIEFFNGKKVNKLSGGCDHSAVHTGIIIDFLFYKDY